MSTTAPGLNNQENKEDHTPTSKMANMSLSSQAIHADDYLNKGQDVAPPLHVSTTFRYSNDPSKLQKWQDLDVYSPLFLLTLLQANSQSFFHIT
jgi:hypothetical protein